MRREPVGGLYDMRARAYDPTTARFLTRDPLWPVLADPQGLNPYQYAYQNPLRYLDPRGTDVTTMDWVSDYLARGDLKPDPIWSPPDVGWSFGETLDYIMPATNEALFQGWTNMLASEDPAILKMGESLRERLSDSPEAQYLVLPGADALPADPIGGGVGGLRFCAGLPTFGKRQAGVVWRPQQRRGHEPYLPVHAYSHPLLAVGAQAFCRAVRVRRARGKA